MTSQTGKHVNVKKRVHVNVGDALTEFLGQPSSKSFKPCRLIQNMFFRGCTFWFCPIMSVGTSRFYIDWNRIVLTYFPETRLTTVNSDILLKVNILIGVNI